MKQARKKTKVETARAGQRMLYCERVSHLYHKYMSCLIAQEYRLKGSIKRIRKKENC